MLSSYAAELEPTRFGVINAFTRAAQRLRPCRRRDRRCRNVVMGKTPGFRERRSTELDLRKEFFNLMHATEAQVSAARSLLRAYGSADGYRDQVYTLIDARAAFTALQRDL